jgi:hypothetical protein
MRLRELVVHHRVRDRRHVKNAVEAGLAKLLLPVQFREILRHEIAVVAGEILEIARAKIVDLRQPSVRIFSLQFENKVRADKAGAAGHEQIEE